MVVLALPAVVRAGDSPWFVVRNWGIGEIDGRITFYLGTDRYLDTPIPAPPQGPRWDIAYKVLPLAVIGGVALWLCRRRHDPTLQRLSTARRGFEVQHVFDRDRGR